MLKNTSKEIYKITEIIVNIYSQTNLFAMNTTIEAAHSGEYKKAFSVVAEKIKQWNADINSLISNE